MEFLLVVGYVIGFWAIVKLVIALIFFDNKPVREGCLISSTIDVGVLVYLLIIMIIYLLCNYGVAILPIIIPVIGIVLIGVCILAFVVIDYFNN